MIIRTITLVACVSWLSSTWAVDIVVQGPASLRENLRGLQPGTTLKIGPGEYPGGYHVQGVEQLTVEALDRHNPPHFKGGTNAWHFSRCHDLSLRFLRISGQSGNGLNIDDGGLLDQPVSGITLEHIDISEVGPTGNHDGIKCSGLEKLTIRECSITGWGGQGIDMVGCHNSLITGCRFIGKPGFSATAGVQTKGGSSNITIEKCHFVDGGERPLNIGGSTDLKVFRPVGAKYEARHIVARGNTIEGGLCAAAFVGVDGAEFIGNKILYPDKWVFRILQETRADGFVPCRNVVVKENDIVFRRAQVQIEVNVGSGTEPKSFEFERNRWLAEDRPQASKPQLPAEEKDGIYGRGLLD